MAKALRIEAQEIALDIVCIYVFIHFFFFFSFNFILVLLRTSQENQRRRLKRSEYITKKKSFLL